MRIIYSCGAQQVFSASTKRAANFGGDKVEAANCCSGSKSSSKQWQDSRASQVRRGKSSLLHSHRSWLCQQLLIIVHSFGHSQSVSSFLRSFIHSQESPLTIVSQFREHFLSFEGSPLNWRFEAGVQLPCRALLNLAPSHSLGSHLCVPLGQQEALSSKTGCRWHDCEGKNH